MIFPPTNGTAMSELEIREKARKKVEAKKGFYSHLVSYAAVGLFFLVLNFLTYNESGTWWFFYPMAGWGIGLFIHYFMVFGIPGSKALSQDWEDEELEREIAKLKERRPELPEPGSENDFPTEELELKEIRKEKTWDDKDLV